VAKEEKEVSPAKRFSIHCPECDGTALVNAVMPSDRITCPLCGDYLSPKKITEEHIQKEVFAMHLEDKDGKN